MLCSLCRCPVEPAYLGSGNTRCENCWASTAGPAHPYQPPMYVLLKGSGESEQEPGSPAPKRKERGFRFSLGYVLNH
jgi:hypothetical protein